MPPVSEIRKIAFLGDYLPRKCGIATFTTDLRCAVATEFPAWQCLVVPAGKGFAQPQGCGCGGQKALLKFGWWSPSNGGGAQTAV